MGLVDNTFEVNGNFIESWQGIPVITGHFDSLEKLNESNPMGQQQHNEHGKFWNNLKNKDFVSAKEMLGACNNGYFARSNWRDLLVA